MDIMNVLSNIVCKLCIRAFRYQTLSGHSNDKLALSYSRRLLVTFP